MSEFRIKGLVAATFTPFTANGDVNLDVIPSYADFLDEQGIRSVFVNGSTGEFSSMTVEERQQVAEAWMWRASKLEHIIIHVGSNCLQDSITLAKHAEELGADAISALAPSYFKIDTVEALVSYCGSLAAAAPNTPFLYYHIPVMTGVDLDMVSFMKLAGEKIPTFRGIKYTSRDLYQGSACVRLDGGKYCVLYGHDEQLLGAVAMGFEAAVGSTYNYTGLINNRIFDLNDADADLATTLDSVRHHQARAQDLLTIAFNHGSGVSAMKEVMAIHGVDVGPVRPPLVPLTPAKRTALKRAVNAFLSQ